MYQAASYPHPHGVYLRELLHCCTQRSDRVPPICLLLKLNMDILSLILLIKSKICKVNTVYTNHSNKNIYKAAVIECFKTKQILRLLERFNMIIEKCGSSSRNGKQKKLI